MLILAWSSQAGMSERLLNQSEWGILLHRMRRVGVSEPVGGGIGDASTSGDGTHDAPDLGLGQSPGGLPVSECCLAGGKDVLVWLYPLRANVLQGRV